jgi:hypothetical protein
MEHKKSLVGPFRELGEILQSRFQEGGVWAMQIVANPSPVHVGAIAWNLLAGLLLYYGMQKVMLHYKF